MYIFAAVVIANEHSVSIATYFHVGFVKFVATGNSSYQRYFPSLL